MSNTNHALDIFTNCKVKYDPTNPKHVEIYNKYKKLNSKIHAMIPKLTLASARFGWITHPGMFSKPSEGWFARVKKNNPTVDKRLTEYRALIAEEAALEAELIGLKGEQS